MKAVYLEIPSPLDIAMNMRLRSSLMEVDWTPLWDLFDGQDWLIKIQDILWYGEYFY